MNLQNFAKRASMALTGLAVTTAEIAEASPMLPEIIMQGEVNYVSNSDAPGFGMPEGIDVGDHWSLSLTFNDFGTPGLLPASYVSDLSVDWVLNIGDLTESGTLISGLSNQNDSQITVFDIDDNIISQSIEDNFALSWNSNAFASSSGFESMILGINSESHVFDLADPLGDKITNVVNSFDDSALYSVFQGRANGGVFAASIDNVSFVPTPSTFGLLALGSVAVVRRRRPDIALG